MDDLERKALRREADSQGLPWTFQTTDIELQAMIEARKERGVMADVTGPEETTPPADQAVPEKPVLKADGKYYYGDDCQQECFGDFWDGVPGPKGEDCRNCAFGEVCLDRFAEETVPTMSEECGGDVKKIAKKLEVSTAAIELAVKHKAKKEKDVATTKKKAPAKKKAPPKKKAPAKKKVPAKKKAASKKSRPSKAAPSAKSAKGAAKKSPGKSAKSAKAPAGKVSTPYGAHTFLDRWTRERKRNKKIRALKVGSKLKVERLKAKHECLVKEGHYLYKGTKYPTLYKVTEAITGKGSSWSGPKFWKLT